MNNDYYEEFSANSRIGYISAHIAKKMAEYMDSNDINTLSAKVISSIDESIGRKCMIIRITKDIDLEY